MRDSINRFFSLPFFSDYRTLLVLWIGIGIIGSLHPEFNNFLIYRGVFHHLIDGSSLFTPYPDEYSDVNHYGPLFSVIIAPFALLPVFIGKMLWSIAMTVMLFLAIRNLPLEKKKHIFIYWFCAHELLTALFMNQFNVVISAIILFSFLFIEKEKDIWATMMIVVGTFVKLYGIVGLAFFFFSKHKVKFILSFFGWSLVCFVLPMLLSSPDYVIGTYLEWFSCLAEKNGENLQSLYQNISLTGMIHKISGCWFSDLFIIIPGMALFAAPYLRFTQYRNLGFRYAFLASVLLFTVLFSTGSESSTYIIAFVGAGIWYWSAPWKRGGCDITLMIIAFILTSLSPSDLFPAYLRVHFVRPFALKALPCAIIWFKLMYEMLFRDYTTRPQIP